MREVEDRARASSGNSIQFAKNSVPKLSMFPAEVNIDLAKIQYEDNKSVYFDIGDFTYAVVKRNDSYNFFVKHNASVKRDAPVKRVNPELEKAFELQDSAEAKEAAKKAEPAKDAGGLEKYLPIAVILLVIACALVVIPVIFKLL